MESHHLRRLRCSVAIDEPGFGSTRLAESGVTISVCPWVNVPDYIAAVNELNKTILETFRARNIVIPLPQREVRMLGSSA